MSSLENQEDSKGEANNTYKKNVGLKRVESHQEGANIEGRVDRQTNATINPEIKKVSLGLSVKWKR